MDTVYKAVLAAGAVCAALAAIGFLVNRVVRTVVGLLQRVGRMTDDFLGRPETAPGAGDQRPGVLAQLRAMDNRLRRVEHQVHRNGGDSMADGVAEIRQALRPDGG